LSFLRAYPLNYVSLVAIKLLNNMNVIAINAINVTYFNPKMINRGDENR